jgi:CheY-like chemotaxis protein
VSRRMTERNRLGHGLTQLEHSFLQFERALRNQLAVEKFLFELSRTFIGLPEEDVDANMERGLAHVGEFLEMDRVTLHAPLTLGAAWDLKPDVFLIDIGLPSLDGYELAAKLKQQLETKDALRIRVSGLRRREPTKETPDPFDYYFTKPVDIAELLALLDQR